ncbi:hypothetical protein QQ999_06930 [Pseudomonas fluorescens]
MNDDLKQSGSTTTSQATTSLEQVKTGRVLDFTWAPNANTTTTIVSADFVDYKAAPLATAIPLHDLPMSRAKAVARSASSFWKKCVPVYAPIPRSG